MDKTSYCTQCTAENGQEGDFGFTGVYPTNYIRTTPIFNDLGELFMYFKENNISYR